LSCIHNKQDLQEVSIVSKGHDHFYGAVTVSERGQIVIPAQARRDLDISVGDKLLVVGGQEGGLLLVRASIVGRLVSRWSDVLQQIEREIDETTEEYE
jgi:AbrB family looped-hinge helix DNA binding protein